MVDAAKSWDALDQIVREFFPCLVDGAVVIHQDYKHFFTHWLHPVTERMLENNVLTMAENIVGMPTQGFRFHKLPDFCVADYLQSAFSTAEQERLMSRSARRFRSDHDRLAAAGAHCQLLKAHGHDDRARIVFEKALRDGGFADNYALSDLLMVAGDWARVLVSTLVKSSPRVKASGTHSLTVSAACHGRVDVVEFTAIDVAQGNELVMNFCADERSHEALRIRVQVADAGTEVRFYDEEFPIAPRDYQAATVPLCGHTKIDMTWTVSSEGSPAVPREIKCIAPMLLTQR
jgi:hypothetical protein